jgi:hypothetical protein
VNQQSHPFQEEMMRKTKGWTRPLPAAIALGLVAWTATGAMASQLSYTTSGQIDPKTGVSGTNVISYVPLQSGNSVDSSTGVTNAGLGNFVITGEPGKTTTYTNTPFQINFLPAMYGSDATVANDSPVVLTGTLNGVVSGSSTSTVTANFSPVANNTFSLGTAGGTGNFSLPAGSLLLAPSTSNDGKTSAQGLINFTAGSGPGEAPVPEPSTIALFLTTIGGLGLRRYVQSRRRQTKV